MRTIVDTSGRHWDVAVSEESYGVQRLLFAIRGGNELRAHELDVSGRQQAEQLLLQLTEPELRSLLAGAQLWHPG